MTFFLEKELQEGYNFYDGDRLDDLRRNISPKVATSVATVVRRIKYYFRNLLLFSSFVAITSSFAFRMTIFIDTKIMLPRRCAILLHIDQIGQNRKPRSLKMVA